jgi:hypothetical protein
MRHGRDRQTLGGDLIAQLSRAHSARIDPAVHRIHPTFAR